MIFLLFNNFLYYFMLDHIGKNYLLKYFEIVHQVGFKNFKCRLPMVNLMKKNSTDELIEIISAFLI